MAAPSACNIQPWEFIVASEKEVLERVIAAAQNGPYNPTAAILVCGSAEFIPWDGDHGVIDCAAAIENMLLAATAMGLGTVWVGGFDSESMAEILDIPEGIIPVGLVYVGYPAESHEPRTRYTEDAVHWNRYDRSIERKPRKGHLFYPDA